VTKVKRVVSVGSVLTIESKTFLLQKRDKIPSIYFPDLIGLFGGMVEQGESYEKAMCRELEEELSIVVNPERLQTILEMDFSTLFLCDGVERRRVFFHLTFEEDELKKLILREGQSIVHCPLSKIPSLNEIVPTDAFALGIVANQILGQQINPAR
jgi:8-oxo-dGTP pyrophosphatase MutT (NUDIX family)